MKYIIPVLVVALLSACGEKVTYKPRPKPTRAQIEAQTPAAIERAKVLFALAYDRLPDSVFDVNKIDVLNLFLYKKTKVLDAIDLQVTYDFDGGCKEGTMAYVKHRQISKYSFAGDMSFCDYFYNRPVNEQAQTIMHEMAHVVEGSGECRAMLFEFWVSQEALGYYTPNVYYWNLNQCDARGFSQYLPGGGTIVASVKDDEGSPLTSKSKPLMADPEVHEH